MTTTSTSSPSTVWPALTRTSATVPAAGLVTRCSIFMASSTTNRSLASTAWPVSTTTRTTVPGMGATSEPGARCSSARGNRASSRSAEAPRGLST